MDMTKGKPSRLIISFAVPLILGNMLQQLYILTDAMIVGKVLGYQALAALGSADWLTWFMNSIINGFTMGYCAKVSQDKGYGKKELIYSSCAMCIFISFILSAIFFVGGQLIARPALTLLRTPADIIDMSYDYLHIIYLALPFALFYNTISALLRAVGDSKTPFVAMLVSSVVNVSLDFLFVYVFKWGMASAAIATGIAHFCAFLICLTKMLRNYDLHFPARYLRPDMGTIKSVLRQSLPLAFQFCLVATSGLVIQYIYNKQGSLFIAGYTAANKYYGLIEMGAIAIAASLLTYTGQNYGAANLSRIKSGIRWGLLYCAVFSAIITIIMLIWGKPLLSLFISSNPEQVDEINRYAFQFLMFLSVPLYILYLHHLLRSILQGMGDIMSPIMSGLMQFIFRIASAFIITFLCGHIGVFAAEPLAWLGSAGYLALRLRFVLKKYERKLKSELKPELNQNLIDTV